MAIDVFDFLEDENGDLLIRDGDFVIGESTEQHQRDLLIANKGEYKVYPEVGVGLNNFLLEDGSSTDLKRDIRKQFEYDGMQVDKIELKEGSLTIEASYNEQDSSSSR